MASWDASGLSAHTVNVGNSVGLSFDHDFIGENKLKFSFECELKLNHLGPIIWWSKFFAQIV